MNKYARDLWIRALDALHTARVDLSVSYDATASRAYYAAFYAVSAFFAIEGREFTRHKAVQAAVHRDLVNLKRWPASLGEDYSYLLQLRDIGDYGGSQHVMESDAHEAIEAAERILDAVRNDHQELEVSDEE